MTSSEPKWSMKVIKEAFAIATCREDWNVKDLEAALDSMKPKPLVQEIAEQFEESLKTSRVENLSEREWESQPAHVIEMPSEEAFLHFFGKYLNEFEREPDAFEIYRYFSSRIKLAPAKKENEG